MALTLADLGELTRTTLRALGAITAGNRSEIAAQSGLTKQQTSSALNRLENLGLVTEPKEPGGAWSLTQSGAALLLFPHRALPETIAEPEPETIPEPEPEPQSARDEAGIPTQLIPDALLRAREIEEALALVRARLQCTLLPATETRIFFQVVEALPPVLQDSLRNITRMVRAASEIAVQKSRELSRRREYLSSSSLTPPNPQETQPAHF